MKTCLVISMLTAASVAFAQANTRCMEPKEKTRHVMNISVDKVDNTNSDHVTRVSCTLTGIPHTSSRIDSVTAVIGHKVVKAVDIDGVDFSRYFQWEDEGAVPVDVDIEFTREFSKNDTIKFHTVHGVYSAPLKKRK